MRPFYIVADIEGRKTDLAGGTRRKDGRQTITIYQRDEGSKTSPFKIEQYSTFEEDEEGKKVHLLHTEVYYLGTLLKEHITNY